MPAANTDKMAATRAANAGPLDLSQGRDPRTLGARQAIGTTRSMYVKRLAELVTAIDAGDAEFDKAYLIGTYGDRATAGQTARMLAKRKDLPGGYDFEFFPIRVEGGSELWAGVVDPNGDLEPEVDVRSIDGEPRFVG